MLVILTLSSNTNKNCYNKIMLGKRIKELRKDNNLTQAQLAEILQVTRSAVALWETDKTDPDIKNIIAIVKYFNVTADYLLGLEDESGRKYTVNTSVHNNFGNINFHNK